MRWPHRRRPVTDPDRVATLVGIQRLRFQAALADQGIPLEQQSRALAWFDNDVARTFGTTPTERTAA